MCFGACLFPFPGSLVFLDCFSRKPTTPLPLDLLPLPRAHFRSATSCDAGRPAHDPCAQSSCQNCAGPLGHPKASRGFPATATEMAATAGWWWVFFPLILRRKMKSTIWKKMCISMLYWEGIASGKEHLQNSSKVSNKRTCWSFRMKHVCGNYESRLWGELWNTKSPNSTPPKTKMSNEK